MLFPQNLKLSNGTTHSKSLTALRCGKQFCARHLKGGCDKGNNMNNIEDNPLFCRAQPCAGLVTPRGCAARIKKLSLQLLLLFSKHETEAQL